MEKYILNIPYFEDEYNYNMLNCIQTPIALATSYYNPDYYYMYGALYTIIHNWKDFNVVRNADICTDILSILGLRLVSCEVKNFEDFKKVVIDHAGKEPIFLVVKYEYLYYHRSYFSPKDYKFFHGLLITGYIPERNIFMIKDRATSSVDSSIEIQVPEIMIKDIWEHSNQDSNNEHSNMANKVFYLDKVLPEIYTWDNLFDYMLSFCTSETDQIIKILNSNNIEDQLHTIRDIALHYFSNSVFMLFMGIKKAFGIVLFDRLIADKFEKFQEEYLSYRGLVICNLIKLSYSELNVEDEIIATFQSNLAQYDEDLIHWIHNLSEMKQKKMNEKQIYMVPIDEYCNNLAFDTQISIDSIAQVNSRGTYLLKQANELTGKLVKNENEYQFVMEDEKEYDNVSCSGQIIPVVNPNIFHAINMLGFTTLGATKGTMTVNYCNKDSERINVFFSDFTHMPSFKEQIVWKGKVIKRKTKNNMVQIITDQAYLFEQTFHLDKNVPIESIVLPQNIDMHIFAITFK